MAYIKVLPCLKGTKFWMDSFDLKLQNPRGYSRKDPRWSFKLNHYGRRYMVMRNGYGKACEIWGGYSPKIYDGHFIEMIARQLERAIGGTNIIADQYFNYGNQVLRNVKIYSNIPVPSTEVQEGVEFEGDAAYRLTKEQVSYNTAHKRLRARVEGGFGAFYKLFSLIAKPWGERAKQLDYLVIIGMGVINAQKSV